MTSAFLASAAASLATARILIALWLLLATAQWLAAGSLFAESQPLAWAGLARRRTQRVLGRIRRRLSARAIKALLGVQLVAAAVLGATGALPTLIACLALLLLTMGSFVLLSGEFWANGSDKIGMIAMAGTLLTAIGVAAGDAGLALAGAIVTGGQLTLCYAVAGGSKLFFPTWRNGTELVGVMASQSWGHPLGHRLTRVRPLAIMASWTLILVEMLFPLALLAPQGWLAAALGVMLAFHVATALLMGLNTFPWAFAAAYPAVLLLGRAIRAGLGLDG